ncbi:tetratricopeptide repeat protein [Rhodobacterales bacterium]|nr:tetratricopeptide repeat protein [Rhodobacterales bacterium]
MTLAAQQAFEQAVLQEKAGDMDKALAYYLKAQELAPQDTEIAYRAASALLQAGYLDEAQSQLRRIVFAVPEHVKARASLGNCQLLLGDLATARQNFTEVLEQVPDNRNALFGLASILLKEDDPEAAAAPAQRLAEMLPNSPAVLTLLARTLEGTGQQTAAIAALQRALKLDASHLDALLNLADLLLLRKRFDEVIDLAIRANAHSPSDPQALELLSDALSGKGALADAHEAANEALKLKPKSASALLRLSVLSRKLGAHGAAMDYALKAHDADVKATGPLNALGAALAALKYSVQARTVLTGLSTGKPLDPPTRAFVESLIKDLEAKETHSQNLENPTDDADQEISDMAAKLAPELEEEEAAVPENSEGKPTPSDPVRKEPSRQRVASSDDDPLPNVLGLRRQDRS